MKQKHTKVALYIRIFFSTDLIMLPEDLGNIYCIETSISFKLVTSYYLLWLNFNIHKVVP